jgi:REP element-mobilizing transposase RayT
MMRRNKLALFLHLVWGTWDRLPMLTPDIERRVHRDLAAELQELKAEVLAINGMPDHVHIVLQLPATIAIAELVKQIKGASSRFVNAELHPENQFKWQGSYGAFTVGRGELDRVVTYVRRQKEHHTEGTVWPEFEETFEEFTPVINAASNDDQS